MSHNSHFEQYYASRILDPGLCNTVQKRIWALSISLTATLIECHTMIPPFISPFALSSSPSPQLHCWTISAVHVFSARFSKIEGVSDTSSSFLRERPAFGFLDLCLWDVVFPDVGVLDPGFLDFGPLDLALMSCNTGLHDPVFPVRARARS